MEIRREKIMKFLSYSSSGGYCPSRWMEVCTSMHTAVYRGTCDAFVCVCVKVFCMQPCHSFRSGVCRCCEALQHHRCQRWQRGPARRSPTRTVPQAGRTVPACRPCVSFSFQSNLPSLLPRSSTIWDTLIVSSKREGERERERKDNPPSSIVTRFHLFLWGEEQGSGGARGEEGSKNKFWWAEVVLLHRWEHDASLLGFECIYAHTDMLALTAVRTDFLHFLILPS